MYDEHLQIYQERFLLHVVLENLFKVLSVLAKVSLIETEYDFVIYVFVAGISEFKEKFQVGFYLLILWKCFVLHSRLYKVLFHCTGMYCSLFVNLRFC